MSYDIYYKKNRSKKHYKSKWSDDKDIVNKIKFYHKQGNYSSAMTLIDDYLKYNYNDMYVQTYRAMTLFKLNKKEESIEAFEKILSKIDLSNKNKIFAMTQYASVLSFINEEDLAIYYYEKILKESNELQLIVRGRLSSLYTKKERYEDAINVLNIDGFNNAFLNVKRAKVYINKGNYNKALNELEQKEYNTYDIFLTEILDDKYTTQEKEYIKGHIYYKYGKFDDALKHLSNVNASKNRSVYYQTNIDIIKILIFNVQIENAVSLCEETKKHCTSKYYLKILDELLAKAYLRKNDYEKAQETYNNIDVSSYKKQIYLGDLELLKGNFEKAEEYFSVLDIEKEDIRQDYKEFYRLILVKFRLKKYDEVLKLLDKFDKNKDKYEVRQMEYELRRIRLFINVLLNKDKEYEAPTYSEKQIIDYDEKDAIYHIMDHHYYNDKKTKFNQNIDIEDFIVKVKDMLDEQKIIYDCLFDKYIIKYPCVGVNGEGQNINQLMVLTLPDTKNIITMYPCDGTESIFSLEELEEIKKPKVKRLTQIEKFNNKYNCC